MSRPRRTEFTENLEAVARGVRRLDAVRDPILREAVAAALRLRQRELRLDPASRTRMRNIVLAALEPAKPTAADRLYAVFAVLGKPAPLLVRSLALLLIVAGVVLSATVTSAESLPEDLLYSVKLAGERARLAVAMNAEDRASVELSIAEHRLDEAERLAAAGREDDAIVATAAYGTSLADAAADLASIEGTDSRTAALVTQMQTTLTASRLRVATTATRLAADPRTVATAEVLATVGTAIAASTDSPATRIADQAAAITAQLARVAGDRADTVDPRHAATPRATATPRTEAPRATPRANAATPRAVTAPSGVTARPPVAGRAVTTIISPESDATAEPSPPRSSTVRTAAAPANPITARQSAERAKEAAEQALEAAAKAKRASSQSAWRSFVRR